jgi:initiation factor 1A
MVKNFGGNKSKKLARKVVSAPRDNKLRTPNPSEPDEQLACVSKMLGNGMCHVMCGDQKSRLCIIRNKFRGRSKRDNNIIAGSFVLIDVRSWESTNDQKIQKCDLLEVYNKSEMDRLIDTVTFDWNIFKGIGANTAPDNTLIENESGFIFTDTDTTELEQNIRENTKTTMNESTLLEDYEDAVDIDDI